MLAVPPTPLLVVRYLRVKQDQARASEPGAPDAGWTPRSPRGRLLGGCPVDDDQGEGDPTKMIATEFGIQLGSVLGGSLLSWLGFSFFIHALEPRYHLSTELHYRYEWP